MSRNKTYLYKFANLLEINKSLFASKGVKNNKMLKQSFKSKSSKLKKIVPGAKMSGHPLTHKHTYTQTKTQTNTYTYKHTNTHTNKHIQTQTTSGKHCCVHNFFVHISILNLLL